MKRRRLLIIAVSLMFLSSAGIVTFLNAQEGAGAPSTQSSSTTSQAGAPREPAAALETRYAPDRILRASGQTVWRASATLGILVSTDGGATWDPRNEGLPVRVVFPFAADLPLVVTGLAVDPLDNARVALAAPDALFLSSDGGASWRKLELKDPIRANDQVTCLALRPGSPDVMAIGTSFHGFFETANGGKTWSPLSEPVASLSLGSGNTEEIAAIAYDPVEADRLWIGLGFGKGLCTYRYGAVTVEKAALPTEDGTTRIRDLTFHRRTEKEGWRLEVRTDVARWEAPLGSAAWKMIERVERRPALDEARTDRLALAADKYGIYVSSFYASGKALQNHVNFIKAQGMNSMVVDFKDDNGFLTYDTALAEPLRIGAVRKRITMDEIVATAHANGLYLIGRIVVFRDKQLYNADGFMYAAWDRAAKGPWRYIKKSTDVQTGQETLYQGEYWVDPYSEHVWDYNIDIARELQDRGVDEVQFDYIRFPSDGDVGGITWRFRKPGMGKREALESFLSKARESLTLPLSTDVYGYCGWARISNWVAQNIEMFSQYVDVIQPMFYPSHFPRDFLGSMAYLPRATYLYDEGTRRAADIVSGRSLIRPYVQAFRIGGELNFTPAVYSTYLQNQVRGALAGGASGFTLWNASNDYYMVTAPLANLISMGTRTETQK